MLTEEDIQKIVKANQKMFATKEDLESFKDEIREYYSDIQSAIERYAVKADAYFQEMVMLSHKIDRHEKWLHVMAEKLGVKLEY